MTKMQNSSRCKLGMPNEKQKAFSFFSFFLLKFNLTLVLTISTVKQKSRNKEAAVTAKQNCS